MTNQVLEKVNDTYTAPAAPSQQRMRTRSRTSVKEPATTGLGHVFSKFVTKIVVRPNRSIKLPIGTSFDKKVPKGFSVALSARVAQDDIDMQVVTAGTTKKYEYLLKLTNNSTHIIRAEIWQM
jgi:hypothetical protein